MKISEATFNELKETFDKAIQEAFGAGVKEGREGAQQTVDEPEMKQPKTVKRHAEVGEKVLITNAFPTHDYKNGEVLTVGDVDGVGNVYLIGRECAADIDEYEVIIEDEIPLQDGPPWEAAPIKSPNRQRYELIQRAREFVKSKYLRGNFGTEKVIHGYHGHNTVEFIVNREKNTVVALLRLAYGWTGKVEGKGIAKCMPGDVFNADVGKAIALARALEIDIPQEFTDAVQPTKLVVGMVIKNNYYESENTYTKKIASISDRDVFYEGESSDWLRTELPNKKYHIIDDTSAEYEMAESS